MTTIRDFDEKCPVCEKTSPQQVMMSTSTWGYPDLDLRPAEMKRSSMFAWLNECPHCGYISGNFENEPCITKDFLKSEKYLTCDGIEFSSKLSAKFFKAYLIANEEKDTQKCFFNLLHCAWTCDDAGDSNAVKIRKMALDHFDYLEYGDGEKKDYLAMKADILRRSGQFDRLTSEFSDVVIGEEPYDTIIGFQIQKAIERDTGCYTVGDAIGK
ncbi:hypothetical protein [Methanobrevibacter sp.]|uniref:hypothetical protein n=1 Tax=Methanobrevibacter sp. TaxID=66852 RepID=UPI0025F4DF3B|nr:hypothetical protein [Methanobrevibacter sp.]MBQ2666527.1 hypothetical protein [Methanobrevibacter sp.]